jgi:hypothetical protein
MCPGFLNIFKQLLPELQTAELSEDIVALPIPNLECTLITSDQFKELCI